MTIQNETDGLTHDMVSHILRLHESGLSQKAIRIDLYEVHHVKISLALIKKLTGKADHLVDEWLDRLKEVGI